MSRYTSERLLRRAFGSRKSLQRARFEVQDLATLVNFVREGAGVAVLPRLAMSEQTDGIVLVPLRPRLMRSVGIAARSMQKLSPVAQAFVEFAFDASPRS
jgi:DNA-binding transcriptional LysR family regulator